MRLRNTLLMACILLLAGMAVLIAAPITEDTYAKVLSMDLSSTSMEQVIAAYDKLYSQVTRMAENAIGDLEKAREKGDRTAFQEAYERYASLSKYAMGKDETDRLLTKILGEPEDKRFTYAGWLYDHSTYYRPTLSIDLSLSGDGYRYSYTQQLQQRPGAEIALPDASQIRVDSSRAGLLAGWGLTPETTDYKSGETIKMPLTDQTLYASWMDAVQFTDSITGTDILHENLIEGTQVEVPQLSGPDEGFRFVGWYDRASRTLLDAEAPHVVSGKGAVFEALWKKLSVPAVNTLYYGFDRLPVNTQIGVGFSLANEGNTTLTGLTATLSTESRYVTLLRDSVSVRDMPPGSYRTNNSRYATKSQGVISGEQNTFRFVVDGSIPSGTTIPFTLTVTDADGETWGSAVTFTVK